jgi:hypothetical protein
VKSSLRVALNLNRDQVTKEVRMRSLIRSLMIPKSLVSREKRKSSSLKRFKQVSEVALLERIMEIKKLFMN